MNPAARRAALRIIDETTAELAAFDQWDRDQYDAERADDRHDHLLDQEVDA